MVLIKNVKIDDCVPMPELIRPYYDPNIYRYLKDRIQREGMSPAYPLRAIWNKDLKKYEIFVGIHRLMIADEIGIKILPAVDDCTETHTRSRAIAEGIAENKTHAYYNPMDLSINLRNLMGQDMKPIGLMDEAYKKRTLEGLSLLTGLDDSFISQHLRLLELPEDIQKLIGQGKLKKSSAFALYPLLKEKDGESRASEIAKQAVENQWSKRRTGFEVRRAIHGGEPPSPSTQLPEKCQSCFLYKERYGK